MIAGLRVEGFLPEGERIVLRFRALVLREHRERSSRESPTRLRLPHPGLEAQGRRAEIEVDVAVGIHERAFEQEVRVDIVAPGAANEPGVDAVKVTIDAAEGGVVAALEIEGELIPIPLRLAAEHSVALRRRNRAAGSPRRREQAEQILLRVAPTPVAADQKAMSRETVGEPVVGVVGRALGLRIKLQAHVTAYPVIAAAGPTQRPAVETNGIRVTRTVEALGLAQLRAGPAAVHLHIACCLLLRLWCRCRRFEHRL